jgi:hypothetical protein
VNGIRPAIETFLASARQPVVIEPGEDPIAIGPDNFVLGGTPTRPSIECWSTAQNLMRRISGVRAERRGKLELDTEHFGGRIGRLLLVDLAHPANATAHRRSDRLKYRERFRLALNRQYPEWRIVELSTDPDLEHTLSPAYPRAMLRKGKSAMAAIGAAEDCADPDGALSFGLIWLDYIRRREAKLSVGGLLVFLPIGSEINTCHRVRHLDAQIAVFVHGKDGEEIVHPEDYTNFTTRVDPLSPQKQTFAVHGVEFARMSGAELLVGIDQKHPGSFAEAEALGQGLARLRHPDAEDRRNPLYTRNPEAWLESQIRANVQAIDGTLLPAPIYGQAPHIVATNRGILDLLAVDFEGRLVVIEIKASEDLHLPLQALDYWMRVKWHLERGDFALAGYFPGITVRPDPPRLLLVAPALQFHPSNESVLRYFSSAVSVERIGVGIEWRRELKVVFRECRSYSSVKLNTL